MKIDYEWTYYLAIAIAILLNFAKPENVDPIHSFFLGFGALLTASTILLSRYTQNPVGIKQINIPAFLMQTSISSVVLGLPVFIHRPAAIITTETLMVAMIAEESYRIAAFKLTYVAFTAPTFAVMVSGVVFAAMHMYWYPAEWLFAIVGGMLFSATLTYFGSETACVLSHYLYDSLCFGFISTPLFFIITIGMGAIGYGIRRLQPLEH
jgi:hypothetical protein